MNRSSVADAALLFCESTGRSKGLMVVQAKSGHRAGQLVFVFSFGYTLLALKQCSSELAGSTSVRLLAISLFMFPSH